MSLINRLDLSYTKFNITSRLIYIDNEITYFGVTGLERLKKKACNIFTDE